MTKKNTAILAALTKAANGRPSPAPAASPASVAAPQIEAEAVPYQAPSRKGKINISAWMAEDYKTGLRAIQVKFPHKSLQDLFIEALNDMFEKYDVPVVSEPARKAGARRKSA